MTIERLETLAADLYKAAEEATPIVGGADKKDWMARKLEQYIEEGDPILTELQNCESTEDVIDLLEIQYEERNEDDDELVEETALEAPLVNPVGDAWGIEDKGTVKMDEPVDTVASSNPDDWSNKEVPEPGDVITTDEAADIPDDELVIVEETVLIIEDDGIIPQGVIPENTENIEGTNNREGSDNKCGCS